MKKNVKLLRLTTGEQLLATVEREVGSIVEISNATLVVIMNPGPGPGMTKQNPTVGLAPWMEFCADKTITLDKSHIMAIMTPIKEFVDQYNTMFSNIITPPSLLLPR